MPRSDPQNSTSLPGDPRLTVADGWRLWRVELHNWGTFHKKVWSLLPCGNWSLLVGENGSGKTTAIDGLRTLLVPPRLLNYNDASGGHAKRDRSRVSYIRGAWAATATEESHLARTEYLRAQGELSTILAVFRREGAPKAVTVAQVLWVVDDHPDELFLVAEEERSIREHLSELKGAKRELRTELRRRGWDVHESFSAYAARFRPLLGIPGEGALEVFNQAIGVKEVDDINRFVRRHLIEKGNALGFVRETLMPLYRELLGCWQRIQKAEEQIAKLRPISEEHAKSQAARERLRETKALLDVVRPYYLDAENTLRASFAVELDASRQRLEEKKQTTNALQDADNQARDRLRGEINSGKIGTRLRELEVDIKAVQFDIKQREGALKALAPALALFGRGAQVADAAALESLQSELRNQQPNLEKDIAAEQEEHLRILQEQQRCENEAKRITASLAALKHHRVNIDSVYLEARAEIARDAGIAETHLPFAGELVEVQERFQAWTGAIERLLRGFGLSLLVPERHYASVSRLINRRHWNLRLQFFRIPVEAVGDLPQASTAAKYVADRLAFKTDHHLAPWVAKEIKRAYPHICCDDETELSQNRYGITREGLIRNGERHVKDDRRHIGDATQFVLGWSLETKRLALTSRQSVLEREISDAKLTVASIAKRTKVLSDKLTAIGSVLSVVSFENIDLPNAQKRYHDLITEQNALKQSSNHHRELERQLSVVETRIEERRASLDALQEEIGGTKRDIEKNQKRLNELVKELSGVDALNLSSYSDKFAELREKAPLSLDLVADHSEQTVQRLRGRETRANAAISSATAEMLPAMAGFLKDHPEFTASLAAKPEFATDFDALRARLEKEELPAHKTRFQEYLNTNLVGNVAMFSSKLEEQLDAARERIARVNEALRRIPFTATTYVQISDSAVKSGEIGPFKARLKECVAGGINPSQEDQLRIFHSIRELLEEIQANPEWAERVTDVRNWLEFGVRELREADNSLADYFAATSGKSGGQKARLAFSILASAIIAQYGLTTFAGTKADTFRLVIIDEVFSRTDEENSRRALELFRSLGLQLIVVSPFDAKARIVEEYVESYHLALNPERNNSSLQHASREQYEKAWQDGARRGAAA